jgi:hypothetical protein
VFGEERRFMTDIFEKYRIVQDHLFESDFDRVVAETKRLGEGVVKSTPGKGKKQ